MNFQIIINYLFVLLVFNQSFAHGGQSAANPSNGQNVQNIQTNFNPSPNDIYTLNSPFSAYDITNKNGSGIAEMGSKPYNQWQFEKVDANVYRLKEVKSGKYLHIQNQKLEVGDIQSNWWSAMWELEHVTSNYYRIKCKWNKYGKPIYIQNPQRSLTIGELADKNAKYGRWRVRKEASKITTTTQPSRPNNIDIRTLKKGAISTPKADNAYLNQITSVRQSASTSGVFTLDMPPPGNQGVEGSCVSWACAYGLKSFEMKKASYKNFTKNGQIDTRAVASPEYLFNRTNINNNDCQTSGSYFVSGQQGNESYRGALSVLKSEGVVTWNEMPYSDKNGCGSVNNFEEPVSSNASKHRIKNYARVRDLSQNSLKTLLKQQHPIVFAANVTDDFMRADKNFIWKRGFNNDSGHAMVIIGYDDSKNAYKILNSWGKSWGDNGYGWLDYEHAKRVINEAYITYSGELPRFEVEKSSFVSVYNEAGYVANAKLTYFLNGRKVVEEENFSLFFTFRRAIPKGAKNVRLEVNGIACLDPLDLDKSFNSSEIKACYKIWGTIFQTEYGSINCEY